jgi:hypothetical protein
VWTCEGNYKDEDKVACKKEVIKILKLCKKEDVLINNPAVANLIYVNRLRKREAMKEDGKMGKTLPEERLPQAKETMQESSDINATGSIVSKGKEYEIISSSQERKNDDPTVEAIVCDERDVVTDDVNIDADEQKEDEIISPVKERKDDNATEQINISDETGLKKDKEVTNKIAIEVVTVEEQEGKKGLDALREYLQAGIRLIGAYNSGAFIVTKDKFDQEEDNCNIAVIEDFWEGREPRTSGNPIYLFRFRPSKYGLLCIDIDIKNGKDGLAEFYNFCKLNGKTKDQLPKMLQRIQNNFPCYVATANSGYHLYFKYNWTPEQKKITGTIPVTKGVEVPYFFNVGGSFKDGKPYVLHGDISKAPPLPIFIEKAIFNTETRMKPPNEIRVLVQKQKGKQCKKSSQQKKDLGKPSWDKIKEWTATDNPAAAATGRNVFAHRLALKAKRKDYNKHETLQFLRNEPSLENEQGKLSEGEIRAVVKSAYKKN